MEDKIKQTNPTLHKYLFTVTTFSKLLAMIIFITLPFVGFYLGMKYQQQITVTVPIVKEVQKITTPTPISYVIDKPKWQPENIDGKFLISYPHDILQQKNDSNSQGSNSNMLYIQPIQENIQRTYNINISAAKNTSEFSLDNPIRLFGITDKVPQKISIGDYTAYEINNLGDVDQAGSTILKWIRTVKNSYVYDIRIKVFYFGTNNSNSSESQFYTKLLNEVISTIKFL